jgi:hypothetical protein
MQKICQILLFFCVFYKKIFIIIFQLFMSDTKTLLLKLLPSIQNGQPEKFKTINPLFPCLFNFLIYNVIQLSTVFKKINHSLRFQKKYINSLLLMDLYLVYFFELYPADATKVVKKLSIG